MKINLIKSKLRCVLFIFLGIFCSVPSINAQFEANSAANQANHELWNKFIDKYGIVNDFVGEIPTAMDCRLSRPNAFGWWTPIEDGAFFTGLYLAATCEKVKQTRSDIDKDKARILAQGLLKLSMVSDVPGFISRGVSTDGHTHYSNGSNDQTVPWFYGLFQYLKTDIPSIKEREIIKAKMVEVINALRLKDWEFPSDGMFTGLTRDDLKDNRFLEAPCYLYLLRGMYELTGNVDWLNWYKRAASEVPKGGIKTRSEVCAEGIPYDLAFWKGRKNNSYLWIYVMKQASLVELASLEKEASIKAKYKEGIKKNREFVLEVAKGYTKFDNKDSTIFGNTDWRACYTEWFPQFTIVEAIAVSKLRNDAKAGLRKNYERDYMTTPLAAASILALAENPEDCKLIDEVVSHYDYSKLFLSEFFYAEFAYYFKSCK